MGVEDRLLTAFETHDAAEIRVVLEGGFDPNQVIGDKPAIDHLIEMYYRSDAFAACLGLMVERGGVVSDPMTLPVLLNDEERLEQAKAEHPDYVSHRVHMPCTFASLEDVTLLHLAAEYGHLRALDWLLANGADANARAGRDAQGFNGHTAIFHTVNSNVNRSISVMRSLLKHGAAVDVRLDGLWWGKGFAWETLCFDVTPLSFAQMGLLPQFQRRETDIYGNLAELMKAGGRAMPHLSNVPNTYLQS